MNVASDLNADHTNVDLQKKMLDTKTQLLMLQEREEEEDASQRSRANWLKLDDRNTMYFSEVTRERRITNSRLCMMDQHGNSLMIRGDLTKEGIEFYSALFSARTSDDAPMWFSFLVSDDMNAWITWLLLED